jgi:hypothetical protein
MDIPKINSRELYNVIKNKGLSAEQIAVQIGCDKDVEILGMIKKLGEHLFGVKEIENMHGHFYRVQGRRELDSTDWGNSMAGETIKMAFKELIKTYTEMGLI